MSSSPVVIWLKLPSDIEDEKTFANVIGDLRNETNNFQTYFKSNGAQTYTDLSIVLYNETPNNHQDETEKESLSWPSMKKLLTVLYLAFLRSDDPLKPITVYFAGVSDKTIIETKASQPSVVHLMSQWTGSAFEVSATPTFNVSLDSLSSPVRATWNSYSDTCLGGTFDHLHAGHKVLLTVAALCTTRRLVCGIADAELLKNKKYSEFVESYEVRKENVRKFLEAIKPGILYEYASITDVYGPAGYDKDLKAIVVSMETESGGKIINDKRAENKLSTLEVEVIDLVMPDKTQTSSNPIADKLSSTYIRRFVANQAAQREHINT